MIAKATRLYRDSKKKRVKRLAEELRKKEKRYGKKEMPRKRNLSLLGLRKHPRRQGKN